ncbi:hypothetical protein LJC09_05340, partial [Desulfovibrio sp. OttesenSCG-928-F20]|nr:hypothetical protein [Desulfovibrio sp. OttesenSCG-928-F20]
SLNRSFSLTASPAMGLLPALDFLRGYPYDCLEQQVSRAWPYLALPALRQALEEPAPDNDKGEGSDNNAAAMLTKYANSICALQRPGGGFAVWPDRGHPDPWRSIYALWFLNEVKDRVPLAGQALDAGSDYLRFVLAAPVDALGSEAQALSIKAFAAMVLTRNHEAPLGWMQHLAGQTDKMLPSGRIFLAGAMALKAGNAAALRTLLEQPKLLAHDGRDEVLNRTMESEARNKALLLWLWSQVEPGAQACRELCLDVLSLLGRQGWFSIQESGVAALAVGAWLEQAGIKAGPYNALVKKGDDLLAEVAEGADLFLSGIKLPSPDENGALAPLDVSLEGKGSAYAVYSASGVPLSPPEAVSNGLVISRVWKNTKGEVIDLSSGTARLERGDRVLVELTVRSERALNDIVLSDLLPGCLEVENARLSSPAVRGEDEEEGVSGLYVDQREDRMLLFFDDLKGEAHYSYSARAVSRGEFILPPLAADAMYDPQINAVTGTGRVIVE